MSSFVLMACVFTVLNEAPPTAIAEVNQQQVFASEVEAELRAAAGNRKLSDDERQRLFKAALDQVIDRHLVMAYLSANNQAASKADIDAELAQFEKSLKAQNLTLVQHAEKVGLSLDEIRRSLAWKLSWKRYCEKYLTPANIEKFYNSNRRDFDGTRLRVAQILIKVPKDADDAAATAANQRAAKLREEIRSGKNSFAEAAKKNSEAPSKDAGGNIGWIERHRPMPEEFSRIAFGLKKGEISEPFVTSFGVHLITILDETPGEKTWQQCEAALRPAVTLYLFRWIADKERMTAKIAYLSGQ